MEVTTENVERAVYQFYHEPANQQDVNRWLTAAQISPQAWSYPWALLQPGKAPEVQFFGASSLHVKIAKFWAELSADQIPQLRTQLMQQIANFAGGPKMVLTRLCVALSSLVLQTIPDTWTTAISDIVNAFQPSNLQHLQPGQVEAVLLEMLTVIPEEFLTSHYNTQRLSVVRNALQKSIPQVLQIIHNCLTTTDTPAPVYEQTLRCLSSWVQFNIPIQQIEPLIGHVFQAVTKDRFFDTAIDTLIHVFSHPDNYRYPQSMQKLLYQVLQLHEMLRKAMEERDTEVCQGLTKLVVTAADMNTKLLLQCSLGEEQQKQMALTLVNMSLMCTGMPGHYPVDECCSDLPYGFWYNLQDDIIALERPQYLILLETYTPVYMALVEVLLRKVQYPPDDEYQSWNNEEKEAHRCYRQDIADTLMYAYNLLHDPLLGSLSNLLASSIEKAAADQVRWQEMEAVLFAVTSIAECVDAEEFVYLPTLFSLLNRVPCSNPKVISQALFLIGSYAEWINTHPEVLGHVLPLLLQGLREPELAQPATLSLKEVVEVNQDHLQPFAQQILEAGKASLETRGMKWRDTVRLMSCLGFVLSTLPVPDIMEYLNIVLAPHIQELESLARLEPSVQTKGTIREKLQMLSWLFGSLNININIEKEGEQQGTAEQTKQPQPVLLVLQQVLPILNNLLHRWINDPSIVEDVCEMIKRALRTLMNDFAPLVSDVTSLVVSMYETVPNPAILDVAKQLLILFASDVQYQAAAQPMFNALSTRSLTIMHADAKEHPDMMEGFTSFLSQVIKKSTALLNHPDCDLAGVFQAGIVGMVMAESPTVKSSCHFLADFLGAGEKVPASKIVVHEQGHHLVEKLMQCIGGASPRAVIDSMGDVFLALNKHQYQSLCGWMNAVVAKEGFPAPHINQADKEKFARNILKERVNKRKVREIVQEYTLLWRGLLGTEYAAQTTSIMDR